MDHCCRFSTCFCPFRKGDVDLFVMKFDSVGAHQWTAQRGGPGEDIAHALQVQYKGMMQSVSCTVVPQ